MKRFLWAFLTVVLYLVAFDIGGVIVCVVAFAHSTTAGIAMVIIYNVYQQIENHVIQPLVMRRSVQVSPFVTLVAVLIGSALLGFVGAILAIPAAASQCLGNEASVITQPTGPVNPTSGAVLPGQNQTTFPFRNFNISDTASNWDYTFRAGIFAGDYNNVNVGPDNTAWSVWTDARNGRSSRTEAGRNPICEQSDIFDDEYSSNSAGTIRNSATQGADLYLVTPCPLEMQDKGAQNSP